MCKVTLRANFALPLPDGTLSFSIGDASLDDFHKKLEFCVTEHARTVLQLKTSKEELKNG